MMSNIFKSSLYLLSFLLCFLLMQPISFAASLNQNQEVNTAPLKLKVAIMPTIARTNISLSRNEKDDVIALLDKDIHNQMYLSLNDTLQLVDYIDQSKVLYAMEDSGFTVTANADTLKQTADLLNADVIVGYTVPIMYKQYFYSFARRGESGPLMQSYISLKLWAYYRPQDKLIVLSNKQQYFDTISTMGSLTSLASDASYNLSKKADLKNLLKEAIQANSTNSNSTIEDEDIEDKE